MRENKSNLNIAELFANHTYLAVSSNKKHLKFLFKWVRNVLAAPESFSNYESFEIS